MHTKYKLYLSHLRDHVIVFDGAMGTNLQKMHLTAQQFGGKKYVGCNDYLNITFPQAVESVHRSFLEVGVDVIETNTFRSNRITLSEFGLAHKIDEINISGAQLARKTADAFSTKEHPRFVAGSMGPSGKLLSLQIDQEDEQSISFNEIRDIYRQQAQSLIAGGVDLLLIETAQDILEVKAAIFGIHDAFERSGVILPIQAQVTLDTNGHMLMGTDIEAVLTILEGMEIDIIGLNCSTGPTHMEPSIKYLSQHSRLPISCLPNAGIPVNQDGEARYPLSAEDFSHAMESFVSKYHISTVGGCCGTTPEHLRLLVDQVSKRPRIQRNIKVQPALSSAFHAVHLKQEPAPFLIGERLNTQGSRAFKRLMLANDFKSAVQLGKQQLAGGAHGLDICTALTEDTKEAWRTAELVKLLASQIDLPLVIDSTDPDVMLAALQSAPGRCLLNSINLENGEEKARRVLALARQFNAAVIALTIDEKGMAATSKKKLEVAQRIYHLAVDECGLDPHAVIFDPLTFTLASGSQETADAGNQTLEGIQLIKQTLPDTYSVLGISNISFGLMPEARKALNSVFLTHAVKAGLDMAILNTAQVTAYTAIPSQTRKLAEDLIFNQKPNALEKYIKHFQSKKTNTGKKAEYQVKNLSIEERISRHILLRDRVHLKEDIDAYIKKDAGADHQKKALEVLNTVLLPAMQEIGDQFASGELILPFVLQSAEIMRTATDHLETYLDRASGSTKGSLVLATVYGDVHDIGKNLIKTIVSNNGYSVVDLGKQVPAEMIIEKALDLNADAIGLSALLVSTSQQMPLIVNMLQNRGERIPVLIGGAAVNKTFADRIRMTENGEAYAGTVHYCKDAFDALKVLSSVKDIKEEAQPSSMKPKTRKEKHVPAPSLRTVEKKVKSAAIPIPPFWGDKAVSLPLSELFKRINHSALYRISWGAGKASGEKWQQYKQDFDARFERMQKKIGEKSWVDPKASYGYWQCSSEGDGILIFPNSMGDMDEPIQFVFPRQLSSPFLCLSDYFAPFARGKKDVVAFQLVTIGNQAADYIHSLQENGDLVESYYAHGLAVQLTEAAAIYMHEKIRGELHIGKKQGKRYSWGYPPIPDLSQHKEIVRLLHAKDHLHIKLTSAYQFIPEYSTAAMIVHHPEATYFRTD
ncbi:MAG: methionine synthase [Anaerolineaceae bacterium]|nr:methionine synthase [Anaerolineaceae bacterium]